MLHNIIYVIIYYFIQIEKNNDLIDFFKNNNYIKGKLFKLCIFKTCLI